eukprot:6214172-Pleurochrysis_carterae.AAC.5
MAKGSVEVREKTACGKEDSYVLRRKGRGRADTLEPWWAKKKGEEGGRVDRRRQCMCLGLETKERGRCFGFERGRCMGFGLERKERGEL